MQPKDIQQIGDELAIKWDDDTESFISLEKLREWCPCAGCKGEMDVMGHVHKGPEIQLTPESFRLVGLSTIGGYAIKPTWADGHSTGMFAFEYLKRVCDIVAKEGEA